MKMTANEVHLYHFAFDETQEPPPYQSLLSSHELERGARFIREIDRKRFYTCYSKLRNILGKYLNINSQDIQFEKNNYGKPFVNTSQNPHNLQFNISHSKHHLLFGFCLNTPIGVDIEETDRSLNVNELAKQILSDDELTIFSQLSEPDKIIGFFNAWTRKEAFIKAIGMGMHFPLKNFSVVFSPNQAEQLLDIQDKRYQKEEWALKHFNITETAIAAVAINTINAGYKIHKSCQYTLNNL